MDVPADDFGCGMTAPRILDVFGQLLDADPDAPVVYDGQSGAGAALVVTRRQLRDLAAAMAADLRELGIGAADCVAVWLPNWSHSVAAHLAALAVGAHVIGINTRYNVDEVAHVLQASLPRAVVIPREFMGMDFVGKLAAAQRLSATPPPAALIVTAPGAAAVGDVSGYDVGGGAAAFPRLQRGGPLAPSPVPGVAVAFTTSGSTGKPKLAAHDEPGVSGHVLAVAARLGLGPQHVMLGVLPLSGVFGYTASMSAVLAGASVLLEPVFDARDVLAHMLRHNVTHLVGGDDLVGRIAQQWEADRCALPMVWMGIADFEGRSGELAAWAEHEFGTTAAGVYGSSELLALAAGWSGEYPPSMRWSGGGELVATTSAVRVADPATNQPLAVGEQGEMQFKGPNVVNTYLGNPELTPQMFTPDGWFRSGDLGRLVAPTVVHFVCRMGDALRLRGFLVDPAEIEARLISHPAVQRTKVVGVEGPHGGAMAVGFVEPRPASHPDEDELKQWCAQTLAKFKVPARIHVIAELPVTSGTNGTKIRTAVLREMAENDGAST